MRFQIDLLPPRGNPDRIRWRSTRKTVAATDRVATALRDAGFAATRGHDEAEDDNGRCHRYDVVSIPASVSTCACWTAVPMSVPTA